MKPCKLVDYFIEVNFYIVADMKQGESKPFSRLQLERFFFFFCKNILVTKNLTIFRKSEVTVVNPLLTLLENPRSWVGLV